MRKMGWVRALQWLLLALCLIQLLVSWRTSTFEAVLWCVFALIISFLFGELKAVDRSRTGQQDDDALGGRGIRPDELARLRDHDVRQRVPRIEAERKN